MSDFDKLVSAALGKYESDLMARVKELKAENAALKEQLAHGFTHKICPNGCGLCCCQGKCAKYGTGSLPPAPKGE